MIQYITCHSPVNMINGIPAFRAGEWPGIKSNKFPKTKKIIHIKKSSNIFNLDDSLSPINKKKFFFPLKKEEELPIKPKRKRIFSALYNNINTNINLKKSKAECEELYPIPIQNHNRIIINREFDFEKREKYYNMIKENFDKKMKENEIINKNKNNNNRIGIFINDNNTTKAINKKFYETVSKNKILGVTLTHELYKKYKNKFERKKKYSNNLPIFKNRRVKSLKNLIVNRKNLEIINEKKQELKHDIDYVASLDEIESRARNTIY